MRPEDYAVLALALLVLCAAFFPLARWLAQTEVDRRADANRVRRPEDRLREFQGGR